MESAPTEKRSYNNHEVYRDLGREMRPPEILPLRSGEPPHGPKTFIGSEVLSTDPLGPLVPPWK